MATKCDSGSLALEGMGGREAVARFDGGRMSYDAGAVFSDYRDGDRAEHDHPSGASLAGRGKWWLCCAAAVACVLITTPMVQAEEKYTKASLIHRLSRSICRMMEVDFYRIQKMLKNAGERYVGEAITVEEAYPYIRCDSRWNNDDGSPIYLDLLRTAVQSNSTFARGVAGIALIEYLRREAQDPYLLHKIVACRLDSVPAAPTGPDWDRHAILGCKDLLEANAMETRNRARQSCPGVMERIDVNPFAAARKLEAAGFNREQARTMTDPYSTVRELEAVGFTREQAEAMSGGSHAQLDHIYNFNYLGQSRLVFEAAGFTREQAIAVSNSWDHATDHERATIPPIGENPSDDALEVLGFTREQAKAIYFRDYQTEREFKVLGFTREQAKALVNHGRFARQLYLEVLGFTRKQAEIAIEARGVGYNLAVASYLEAAGATREQAETAVKAMRSRCLDDDWRFTKILYEGLAGGPIRDQAFCQKVLNEPLHCAD